jgi:uncharacterized membrane protein YdjX (TVP38/TMEM64 family)/Fe-S oxidoreductase
MPGREEHVEFAGDRDLREALQAISSTCIKCDLCQRECRFLKKYGKPKDIADRYDPSRKADQEMPFECSLCGLCAAVCPKELDPAGLFLRMRRETAIRGNGDWTEHATLREYERRGTSRRYSYYGLPESCDTVFFPGCALSGTRSEDVIHTYKRLKEGTPSLGIVLDCCTKPSRDLGRTGHFHVMFEEMRDYLMSQGVKTVIAACPNCYNIFRQYGSGLSTKALYEILAENLPAGIGRATGIVSVHDPCGVRFDGAVHNAVRKILRREGFSIEEMGHTGSHTLCCGEGGAVGLIDPDLAGSWTRLRQDEAAGRKIVTYCAGCASRLSRPGSTFHILDILGDGKTAGFPDRPKVARPPFTYWKRLRLKRWFKKQVPVAATRERKFTGKEEQKRGGAIKFILFLLCLAAVVITVKATGASRYLEEQTLRAWIEGAGIMAPIVYMLLYTLAPVLFLPGLPITVVGGVLFGPFWGVVYTIVGATMGASVAFLVSRYLAREWVEGKLKNPRWNRLDEGVERHGWKVVAFTRLVPLFPFNLLNYAFGLTRIAFRQYVVATFVCMLPACIAFIVFSSSLLDLIRGKVSLTFVAGLLLVVIVSLFPAIYRHYISKKGGDF